MTKLLLNKQDEYYTPPEAVYPILEFIKPKSTILCPFDTDKSYFVKIFKESGHKVFNSHISEGKDFFKMRIKSTTKIDYIISNPPYSIKDNVFEKLLQLDIPFAMLINDVNLFDSKKRFELFKNKEVELLYLYPRVAFNFINEKGEWQKTSGVFQSVYLCYKILKKNEIKQIKKN